MSDFGRMLGSDSDTSEHEDVHDDTHHDTHQQAGDGDDYYQTFHRERPRRRRRRGGGKALLVLVVIAVLVVGVGVVGFGRLKDRLAPAPDYPGPGTGSVSFQVTQGESVANMGNGLKAKGVVKSTDAFIDAAKKNDRSSSIQVGYYQLKKQMKAADALAVLVDPDNIQQTSVTIPEGARVRDIITTIVKRTKFTEAQVNAVLKDPTQLGLPAAAGGNPEGYLFPATYTVTPDETPAQLLQQMVQKTEEVEQELDLVTKAKAVNLDPEQVFTVASILEYEANRAADYPKVARVIYNRLNKGMALQLDSTVSYLSQRKGDVWTTAAERASDSKYNTYKNTGLPPGPIGNPGEATLKAALAPAKGSWLYFLPDYENNTTLFFDEDGPARQKALADLKKYCQTHDSC
ncbi:endolytic transglycosylase MltG [Nocardioides mangrovicus]|uniref:Endolytic murein transglycosylase n=1 Tax=Nocardioides mangrovicus TaxID=2478913 RepID=A0A3L8P576_9ACTN|nr:endolytic transglycosylase MltG [Nocardioides mangrovicus]RLV50202.1 endolytic transglycosylase MltG [Nocardioides mangrovicus]